MRFVISFFGLMALLVFSAMPALTKDEAPLGTTPAEAKLGTKVCEEIEKQAKLVKDEATIKKLEAMAADIAPLTQRPKVVYRVKILDDRSLNAMAVPGGYIYMTKGLIDAVEGDDELAGVLAHEIAHNARFHQKRAAEQEAKNAWKVLLATIATIYVSSTRDTDVPVEGIATTALLVMRSLNNGYTVELESEADEFGARYLYRSNKYSPVGLFSVILGFEQIERLRPQIDWGYLKTHPDPTVRRKSLEALFKELGIKINLWPVINFWASLVPPDEKETGYTVKLGTKTRSTTLITLTEKDGDTGAKSRAESFVAAVNYRLRREEVDPLQVDLDTYDLKKGLVFVRISLLPVLTLTEADAKAAGTSLGALGKTVVQGIQSAISTEKRLHY
ncbi:MAG: M48 family metalloprotease [Armatimonadota bacterium]